MGMQAHTWLNKFLSGRIQVKNDLTGFKQVFQTHESGNLMNCITILTVTIYVICPK